MIRIRDLHADAAEVNEAQVPVNDIAITENGALAAATYHRSQDPRSLHRQVIDRSPGPSSPTGLAHLFRRARGVAGDCIPRCA
jgi:hypothetical protein